MSNPTPKNVIWITTDHMRFDCINKYGNPVMHTPNLDKLVENGVNFTNCFSQSSVCMPSRCSFMTGLYPQQTGVTTNGHCLPADFEPTVAKLFKSAGYLTAQIGKLHFQPHEDNDFAPGSRYDYGFDIFWLAEEPGCYDDAYIKWLTQEHPELVDKFRIPRPSSPNRVSVNIKKVIDAPWQASFSGWISTIFSRYFTGVFQGREKKNNFVHLGFYAPHPPLNPTKEMFEPYKNAKIPTPRFNDKEYENKPVPMQWLLKKCSDWTDEQFIEYRRYFYAMVTGIDFAIGEILNVLEKTNKLDDTLIVFVSDHGDYCGDHRCLQKGSFYDEILHMPCILHWPKGFGKKRRDITGLTEMVDILPTLLELCGSKLHERLSGKSYAQALLSGKKPETREEVIAFTHPDNAMVRTKDYKYIRYNRYNSPEGEVLFDLNEKPFEITNHINDKSYSKVVNDMRERMLSRFLAASKSALPINYRF